MGTQNTYTSLKTHRLRAGDLWSNAKSPCADPGIFVGGWGGVQARRPETAYTFFLVFTLFYTLQWGSRGFITEKTVLF